MYVVGGFTLAGIVPTVEIYDPASDQWTAGPDLPEAMHHANVVAVGSSLYVLGFLKGGTFDARGSTYVLDTTGGSWETRAPMPAGTQRGASAIAAVGARVFVVGGFRGGAVDDASVYDTESDTWSELPPLPEPRDHGVGAAANGVFYALGGRDGDIGAISGSVYAFDEETKTWCETAPMPTPRGGTAAALIGGKIVVVGGEGNAGDPAGVFREAEGFDPVANRWEILTPLSEGRHGTGAAAVNDVFYFPGGADRQALGAVATVESLSFQ